MSSEIQNRQVQQIKVAICWCLAYQPDATKNQDILAALRGYFYQGVGCTDELAEIVAAVSHWDALTYPETLSDLQTQIAENPLLWQGKIGLVYGGATKIKPYVFNVPKLHEIRGASALLDNINLVDLPAFFHADQTNESRFIACRNAEPGYAESVRKWLQANHYEELQASLIPELIIYSTGGNIWAFCPPACVIPLANAIEHRYTSETFTANSCAVGLTFKALELHLGLLPDPLPKNFPWLEHYQQNIGNELVQAYLKIQANATSPEVENAFKERKSFNELVSKLTILFNQRRAGNQVDGRPSRRYPAMFETHPYLQRDTADKCSAVLRADQLPNVPWYAEPSARKRIIGQIAKKQQTPELQEWYRLLNNRWQPNPKAESWVTRFERYLETKGITHYYRGMNKAKDRIYEAQTVAEIGNASQPKKYIGYIYADGNNMGGYIQGIRTPQEYRKFSEDISRITEESVYQALAEHLTVHQLSHLTDSDSYHKDDAWIHPFEILTVGGDDVMLIVPASRAMQIANSISRYFQAELAKMEDYHATEPEPNTAHRCYNQATDIQNQSQLSTSIGVLITAEDTPILYARNLTEQLLKSAKSKAKKLKKAGYYGGTIDFLVLKSVTMISSDIQEFRRDGLTKTFMNPQQPAQEVPKDIHLYAAPYTLNEIDGLIHLIQQLKAVDFPKNQLYQIRSFLERGRRTAILNYRYFRTRLAPKFQALLESEFEQIWCPAKENAGNIAPWMFAQTYYETIWRELVDLYEFIPTLDQTAMTTQNDMAAPSTTEVTS
jgi:CRISPR-associated protein Cmr2